MNNIKLSNLDNNPMLTELADEEAVAVNGGGGLKNTIIKLGIQIVKELLKTSAPAPIFPIKR
jgi:hypothetical protein